MSNTTPIENVTKDFPDISGYKDTKGILKTLFCFFNNIPKDSKDPLLSRVIALDMKTMNTKNKISLEALDLATITSERIDVAIGKMPKTNKLVETFKQKSNLSKQDIEKLKKRGDELLQEFRQYMTEQREQISEFIIHNPNRTEADIERLKTMEEELERYKTTINQYKREFPKVIEYLNNLNKELPVEVRADIPAAAPTPEVKPPELS